jgi:hypothetical protein
MIVARKRQIAPRTGHDHETGGCATHRKQAEGWRLEQPQPGVLAWHTPAGRSYTTTPTRYAS